MYLSNLWIATILSFGTLGQAYTYRHGIILSQGASGARPMNASRFYLRGEFPVAPSSGANWMNTIGNVGSPYGSNIIEVSGEVANQYKYVAQFEGPVQGQSWTVVIWNNMGPDGSLGGWYGKACRTFPLAPGQFRYLAFDENSQGGWAMAPGNSIPIDSNGAYASTWGEFDFGSSISLGWSRFDVSAIAAQNAGLEVQGMKICDVITHICSSITRNAGFVHNAYTNTLVDDRDIGGKLAPGPARLSVTVDYDTQN